MVEQESRQSLGKNRIGEVAVLVPDPLEADSPIFYFPHFRQFRRINAAYGAVASALHEIGHVAGCRPMNLFDEPPDQVSF